MNNSTNLPNAKIIETELKRFVFINISEYSLIEFVELLSSITFEPSNTEPLTVIVS